MESNPNSCVNKILDESFQLQVMNGEREQTISLQQSVQTATLRSLRQNVITT